MKDNETISKVYSFSTKSKELQKILNQWKLDRMLSSQITKNLKATLKLK